MITIPRKLVRRLRAVFRKTGAIRRAQPPAVVFEATETELRVRCLIGPVTVQYHTTGNHPMESLAIPLTALADFEGRDNNEVSLRREGVKTVIAEWGDGGTPQRQVYEAVDPATTPVPETPAETRTIDRSILSGLADVMSCAASDRIRFAMDCVQVQGRGGRLVGTDGKQALVVDGFDFPWKDDVLVPRTRLFGGKEITSEELVEVGRTEDHVVFVIGPWRIWLEIEKDARFPDVEGCVPRANAAKTHVHLTAEDAKFLVREIPKLPGKSDPNSSITVDCNGHVVICASSEDGEQSTELVLTGSRAAGKPVVFRSNRDYLKRAVDLGFTDLHIIDPNAPIVCTDATRRYLWRLLGGQPPARQGNQPVRIESGNPAPSIPVVKLQPQGASMPRATSNGSDKPQSNETQPADPIATLIEEAESLKQTLRDAAAKTNDLITSLKQHRKHAKAVQSTIAAIRQLDSVA